MRQTLASSAFTGFKLFSPSSSLPHFHQEPPRAITTHDYRRSPRHHHDAAFHHTPRRATTYHTYLYALHIRYLHNTRPSRSTPATSERPTTCTTPVGFFIKKSSRAAPACDCERLSAAASGVCPKKPEKPKSRKVEKLIGAHAWREKARRRKVEKSKMREKCRKTRKVTKKRKVEKSKSRKVENARKVPKSPKSHQKTKSRKVEKSKSRKAERLWNNPEKLEKSKA